MDDIDGLPFYCFDSESSLVEYTRGELSEVCTEGQDYRSISASYIQERSWRKVHQLVKPVNERSIKLLGFHTKSEIENDEEPALKRRRLSSTDRLELHQPRKLVKSVKHLATEDEQPNKGKIYGRRGDGRFAPKSQIIHSLQGRKCASRKVSAAQVFDESYIDQMYYRSKIGRHPHSRMHIELATINRFKVIKALKALQVPEVEHISSADSSSDCPYDYDPDYDSPYPPLPKPITDSDCQRVHCRLGCVCDSINIKGRKWKSKYRSDKAQMMWDGSLGDTDGLYQLEDGTKRSVRIQEKYLSGQSTYRKYLSAESTYRDLQWSSEVSSDDDIQVTLTPPRKSAKRVRVQEDAEQLLDVDTVRESRTDAKRDTVSQEGSMTSDFIVEEGDGTCARTKVYVPVRMRRHNTNTAPIYGASARTKHHKAKADSDKVNSSGKAECNVEKTSPLQQKEVFDWVDEDDKSFQTQMVLLQRKPEVNQNKAPHLLEIQWNYPWESIRSKLLSKVSMLAEGELHPSPITFTIDDCAVCVLPREQPVKVPKHLRSVLSVGELNAIRVQITQLPDRNRQVERQGKYNNSTVIDLTEDDNMTESTDHLASTAACNTATLQRDSSSTLSSMVKIEPLVNCNKTNSTAETVSSGEECTGVLPGESLLKDSVKKIKISSVYSGSQLIGGKLMEQEKDNTSGSEELRTLLTTTEPFTQVGGVTPKKQFTEVSSLKSHKPCTEFDPYTQVPPVKPIIIQPDDTTDEEQVMYGDYSMSDTPPSNTALAGIISGLSARLLATKRTDLYTRRHMIGQIGSYGKESKPPESETAPKEDFVAQAVTPVEQTNKKEDSISKSPIKYSPTVVSWRSTVPESKQPGQLPKITNVGQKVKGADGREVGTLMADGSVVNAEGKVVAVIFVDRNNFITNKVPKVASPDEGKAFKFKWQGIEGHESLLEANKALKAANQVQVEDDIVITKSTVKPTAENCEINKKKPVKVKVKLPGKGAGKILKAKKLISEVKVEEETVASSSGDLNCTIANGKVTTATMVTQRSKTALMVDKLPAGFQLLGDRQRFKDKQQLSKDQHLQGNKLPPTSKESISEDLTSASKESVCDQSNSVTKQLRSSSQLAALQELLSTEKCTTPINHQQPSNKKQKGNVQDSPVLIDSDSDDVDIDLDDLADEKHVGSNQAQRLREKCGGEQSLAKVKKRKQGITQRSDSSEDMTFTEGVVCVNTKPKPVSSQKAILRHKSLLERHRRRELSAHYQALASLCDMIPQPFTDKEQINLSKLDILHQAASVIKKLQIDWQKAIDVYNREMEVNVGLEQRLRELKDIA